MAWALVWNVGTCRPALADGLWWAMRKYKRLRGHPTRTARFLAAIAKRDGGLFAHWASGAQPTAG